MAHGCALCFWLGLCPDNDISGGRVLWRGARRTKNRAGTLFRFRHILSIAIRRRWRLPSPHESQTRPGCGNARLTRLSIIFYTTVKNQVEYDAALWAQRDAMREKRLEARLHQQAAKRGYKLVPPESAA